MESETVFISGAMGMLGTVVGIVLGHYLSKKAQQEQWVRENKKAEYRELLSVINESFMLLMELRRPGIALGPEEQRELLQAETKSVRTIADRIYVAEAITKINLMKRWTTALTQFKKDKDIVAFGNETSALSEEIRRAALKGLGTGRD